MKRVFVMVVTLILAFSLCANADQSIYAPADKSPYFISMAVCNAIPYLLSGNGELYCFSKSDFSVSQLSVINHSPEMEAVTAATALQAGGTSASDIPGWLVEDAKGIQLLFSDAAMLYGLNTTTGALYKISISSDMAAMESISRLDFINDTADALEPYISCGALIHDQIILSISWDGGKTTHVCSFDISTGVRRWLNIDEFVPSMAVMTDDTLMLLKKGKNGESISQLNTVTQIEKVSYDEQSVQIDNAFYDPYDKRIILKCGDEFIALTEDGRTITVGYLNGQSALCGVMLPGGLLVFTGKSLILCELAEGVEVPTPLVIATNTLWGDAQFMFEELNPNIPLEHLSMEPYAIGPLFAEHMNVGSSQIDIYEIPLQPYLKDSIKKMYYTPLQANPNIASALAKTYPFIASTLDASSAIPALMGELAQSNIAYSRYVCARLNISPDMLPKTFDEFLAFCLDWESLYGAQAEALGISLFNTGASWVKYELANYLKELLVCMLLNEPTPSGSPISVIGALLDKMVLLEKQLPEQVPDSLPTDRWYVNGEPSYLFTLKGSILPNQRNYSAMRESVADFSPLFLSLLPNEKPVLIFTGSALVINPYSKQQRNAQYYLDYYAANIPGDLQAQLFLDATPVESRNYVILTHRYAKALSDLEQRLKKASEADKRDVEIQIEQTKKSIEALELVKWDVAKESINEYQQALSACDVLWYDETVLPAALLLPLWESFDNGSIDGETYIQGIKALADKYIRENK